MIAEYKKQKKPENNLAIHKFQDGVYKYCPDYIKGS